MLDQAHISLNSNFIQLENFSGISILLMSLLCYLVAKSFLDINTKLEKQAVGEKFFLDYLIYATFILHQPGVSQQHTPNIMRSKTNSGFILTATIILGGFLIVQFYKAEFLSYLTVPSYEKPIKDIPGNTCKYCDNTH